MFIRSEPCFLENVKEAAVPKIYSPYLLHCYSVAK